MYWGSVMPDKEILMYAHAGSGNHGCEAIVRSMCSIAGHDNKIAVISNNVAEDESYNLDSACRLIQERDISKHFFTHALYYAYRKFTGEGECFLKYRYANAGSLENYKFAVSIGGDNYCYDSMITDLENANRMFHQNGLKTVLLGCSIEPELIKNRADVREDMKLYDRIIARESITYNALIDAGLSNAILCPDSAFTLKPVETEMPREFSKNTVGINISPMVQNFVATGSNADSVAVADGKTGKDIVMRNYEKLIEYILKDTDMNIALIPHVVWNRNDDRKPLQILYDEYKATGRVLIVSDRSCGELKTIISKCRFFVGARTHATIAAYSSCVPTLVVGYSVKSRGIAKDLFGTDEHYVISVQDMKSDEQLSEGFVWLTEHEDEIMMKLNETIMDYTMTTRKLEDLLRKCV